MAVLKLKEYMRVFGLNPTSFASMVSALEGNVGFVSRQNVEQWLAKGNYAFVEIEVTGEHGHEIKNIKTIKENVIFDAES